MAKPMPAATAIGAVKTLPEAPATWIVVCAIEVAVSMPLLAVRRSRLVSMALRLPGGVGTCHDPAVVGVALQHRTLPLVTGDPALTSLGAVRLPDEPWMALVGTVAARGLDPLQGQRPYPQTRIGSGHTLHVRHPG